MFYKEGFLENNTIEEFDLKKSKEFCVALYRKLSVDNPDIQIHYIVSRNDITGINKIKPILVNKKSYIDINGQYILNNYSIERIKKKYQIEEDIKLVKLTHEELSNHLNPEYLNEAENLLSDFYNLSFSKTIHDKNGDEYYIEIIENADPTLLGELVQDKLNIYKNNIQIGYVKAKYTNEDITNKLFPNIIFEYINEFNIGYQLNQRSNPEDILKALENKRVINNVDYSDINKMMCEAEKQLLNNKNIVNLIKTSKDYWNNKATIEYSLLEEDYQGLGLSQIMYFYLAKHLNNKGIEFRSSVIQSEHAKKLWGNLKSNFPKNVNESKIQSFPDREPDIVYFFNVNNEEECDFVNGKLNNINPINDFLTKKIKKSQNKKNQIKI